jgi:tetratricopeptide (TPR) repeat protein
MEASNNQGKASLPSAASASEEGSASTEPLKLQVEVALPRALTTELAAWRKTFERFADVMERWLESSLAHPHLPAPPPMPSMPWPLAPARPPEQPVSLLAPEPPAPLPPPERPASLLPARGESQPSPAALAAQPVLPDDMAPILVEETRPLHTAATVRPAVVEEATAKPVERAIASQPVEKTEATAKELAAAAEEAATLAQRGERHRAAGHKEKALEFYREALALDSECTQAYLGRASIYIEQARFNEALIDCNAALRREPERAVLYVLRGLVYMRMGNPRRALEEANDAIRFDSQLPSAYMLRGTARFKTGEIGEALTDVRQAIRLRPGDAKFHAELGRLLAHSGQHEQAAGVYAKVLELAPNFHEARLQRGIALRMAGEPGEGESELSDYLRHCPRSAAGHYQRGLCRLEMKNYAQATTDFDKAIALNPDDKAAIAAKQKTLDLWEGSARQSSQAATASTVAWAATSTSQPTIPLERSASSPSKPIPSKTSPSKAKPSPSRSRSRRPYGDDEPAHWVRPVKWVCTLLLVGVLGFGGFRLLANVIHNPYKPDNAPDASAKLKAAELVQRFQAKAASASTELSQHFIEVTGTVGKILEDKSPQLIILSIPRSYATVTCELKANPSLHQQALLSRIEGGSQVVLVGMCEGLKGNTVNLKECHIVKVFRGNATAPR